ncbi:hypothetical protein MHBO_004147, partial [Bonamia ostreae]
MDFYIVAIPVLLLLIVKPQISAKILQIPKIVIIKVTAIFEFKKKNDKKIEKNDQKINQFLPENDQKIEKNDQKSNLFLSKNEVFEQKNDKTDQITIYYGSQTGTAEGFAYDLQNDMSSIGYSVKVVDIEEYETKNFLDKKFSVFIVATFGDGDPT